MYCTEIHEKIIENFDTIITTNFDAAFEEAFKKEGKSFKIQVLPNFNPFTMLTGSTIVYLHGNKHIGKYIFRFEEYEAYYPSVTEENDRKGYVSYELENILKYLFKYFNIVFIGFSFDDRYFVDYLKKIIKEYEAEKAIHKQVFNNKEHPVKDVKHFAIVYKDREKPDNTEQQKQEEKSPIKTISDLGINVITYGDIGKYLNRPDHKQVLNILNKIFKTNLEKGPEGEIEDDAKNK